MSRWIAIAFVLAACAQHANSIDAPPASTLTLDLQAQGIATSSPPGISCGACEMGSGLPWGSDAMCAAPQTACSVTFAPGTSVALELSYQDLYLTEHCAIAGGSAVTCSFVLDGPLTVSMFGDAAVR